MSCREHSGSSAVMTGAEQEHPNLSSAQVSSVLHGAIRAAKEGGREATPEAFRAQLDHLSQKVNREGSGFSAHKAETMNSRIAHGRQDENMPDGAHRAALAGLDERLHQARHQMDNYVADAAARSGQSPESLEATFKSAHQNALDDHALVAGPGYKARLRTGNFTDTMPSDRATLYALQQVANSADDPRTGSSGAENCPQCGQFMGDSHTCAPTATPDEPVSRIVAIREDLVAAAEVVDAAERAEDPTKWGEPGWGNNYGVADTDPATGALSVFAAMGSEGAPRALTDMPLSEGVKGANAFYAEVLAGDREGYDSIEVDYPEMTLEEEMEAFADFRDELAAFTESVNHLEDDVVARMDAGNVRSFLDEATTVTGTTAGGVSYSNWDKDAATAAVAEKIAEIDGLDVNEVNAVLAERRTVMPVNSFRTRALRELGLKAGDYADATPARRVLTTSIANEQFSQPNQTDPNALTEKFRRSSGVLSNFASKIEEGRDRNSRSALDEQVNGLAVARKVDAQLKTASNMMEKRLTDRMATEGRTSMQVGGQDVGVMRTPKPTKSWDMAAANAQLNGKIAASTGVPESRVAHIMSRFDAVAPATSLLVRGLPSKGMDADALSTPKIARTSIKWNAVE